MLGIPTEAGANWGLPAGMALGNSNDSAEGGLNFGAGVGTGVDCDWASGEADGEGNGVASGSGGVGKVTEGAAT